MKNPPKVFISYSWDNEEHKDWVLELSNKLRSNGIDSNIDQYELQPGHSITQFMEKSIRENDFVLFICTPEYKDKFNDRNGGVGYEGDIITGEQFYSSNKEKYIPILRKGKWSESAPSWALSKSYLDFRNQELINKNFPILLSTLKKNSVKPPPIILNKTLFKIVIDFQYGIESIADGLKNYNFFNIEFPHEINQEKNRVIIELASIDDFNLTIIKVLESLVYVDWKKHGFKIPPEIDIYLSEFTNDLKFESNNISNCFINCYISKTVFNQLTDGLKKLFISVSPDVLSLQEEKIFGHVLRDFSYYQRENVLKRFAFTWLIFDQLPIGSWGHSVSNWMDSVWINISDMNSNKRMEDEGGFETTILNLMLLIDIISYEKIQNTNIWNTAWEYLKSRFDGEGFGPLESNSGLREGSYIKSSVRHTALTTFLLGKIISSKECLTNKYDDYFIKGIRKLFLKEIDFNESGKTILKIDERNPSVQYFLYWNIIKFLNMKEIVGIIQSRLDIEMVFNHWNQSSSIFERQLLSNDYSFRGECYTTNLVIPYCKFPRMEVYTFLTSALFINNQMPKTIVNKYKNGLELIVKKYVKEFGTIAERYSSDYLREKIRGIRGVYEYLENNTEEKVSPDLGCTAMMLRILRDDYIVNTLWNEKPVWLNKICFFLNEDLLESFDKFIIHPEIFDLTNAGMLANCIIGDSIELTNFNIDKDLLDYKFDKSGIVKTKTINDIISNLQDNKNKAQISAFSLSALIQSKRPRRYIDFDDSHYLNFMKNIPNDKKKTFLTSLAYNDCIAEFKDVHLSDTRREIIEKEFAKMEKHLSKLENKTLLDAGCGLGDFANHFKLNGYDVTAIDISQKMIDSAKSKYPNVDFKVMDMVEIPENWYNMFDGIICVTAFQHIPYSQAIIILKKFYNALRKDGILRIDIQKGREMGYDPDLRYIESYKSTDDAINKLEIKELGFKISEIREWKLKKGKNSYQRKTEFNFVEFWLKK